MIKVELIEVNFLSWEFEKKSLKKCLAVKKPENPSIVLEVMDNSRQLLSLPLHEGTAVRHCELYMKYIMKVGWMKDNVFQM